MSERGTNVSRWLQVDMFLHGATPQETAFFIPLGKPQILHIKKQNAENLF
jgi:hypothetical protein